MPSFLDNCASNGSTPRAAVREPGANPSPVATAAHCGSKPISTRHLSFPVSASSANRQTDQTAHHDVGPSYRLRSQKYCMKSSIVGQSLDRDRVVIIPLPCKSWDCPICGPRKRAAWITRLASGKPERELTLTCPVGKFLTPSLAAQAMKTAFQKLIALIRKQWGPCEYALVWELTKKGIPHCHILLRGNYIAQKWVSRAWNKLGIGTIVYINSVKGSRLHAGHACKYLAKSNGQSAKILAPLRVIQLSKNYELEHDPRNAAEKYPDFVWVWDRRPPAAVVADFKDHLYVTGIIPQKDGSVEISMHPHPDPDFTDETAAFWVAFPGVSPDAFSDCPFDESRFSKSLKSPQTSPVIVPAT